ncbi:3-hydroxyisobutyryl-CoA hydrolase [Corynebacterium pseudotuberculosis]|uniref:enoyl-CoA hydratase/isomerase family protein n=1 Tax=Corynebacterium pseudotuberculosis TaxID=1719 RepID=UPI000737C86F|nr:enoyl-CoA hydratase/isomerase family protein [Corynebacterium pseudotuberculosis]ALU22287.1 3-hydroxyisobutyryl-CoA hydrolase [Corynebacterium pseudotuberculosis]
MNAVDTTWRDQEVVNIYVENTTGIIELNRPKALNSLNQEMIDRIDQALDAWWDDDAVHRVIVCSTSEKAFCAGGDVRTSREQILAGKSCASDQFFADEYEMNNNIALFPKPYISLIDGVAMGGGLGVSVHGSHRIISEKAFAAMPEMAIGFNPDVGVPFMLQRMTGLKGFASLPLAKFLVLTGWRMSPADMMWAGVATDFVPSSAFAEFREMIIAESLDEALEAFPTDAPGESELEKIYPSIEKTFGFDTWPDIEHALGAHPDRVFAAQVTELLKGANPESLVASTLLMRASALCTTLREELDHEVALGEHMRANPNFAEGVRAVLVDKDREPHFDPKDTETVNPAPFEKILGLLD